MAKFTKTDRVQYESLTTEVETRNTVKIVLYVITSWVIKNKICTNCIQKYVHQAEELPVFTKLFLKTCFNINNCCCTLYTRLQGENRPSRLNYEVNDQYLTSGVHLAIYFSDYAFCGTPEIQSHTCVHQTSHKDRSTSTCIHKVYKAL